MRISRYIGLALLLCVGQALPCIGQPIQSLLASKAFVGGCDAGCNANVYGPWSAGSVVRWRIAVANPGYSQASACEVSDILPSGFTYLGNETYYYGAFGGAPSAYAPRCCQLTPTVPQQIDGIFLEMPMTGENNLTWRFSKLPGQSGWPTEYLVIDFDVLVGDVSPGRYCNSFTFSARQGSSHPGLPGQEVQVTSNTAQVTISDGASISPFAEDINPYLTGELGTWYPATTWSYVTDRTPGDPSATQANIRVDGVFSDYSVFWEHDAGGWHPETDGWQWVETVTKKDVNGLTLETRDVLGRHNALLTGYRNRQVVAQASNARTNEILYDGFEDWNYVPIAVYCDTGLHCIPSIVDWKNVFALDSAEAHTGRYSGLLVGSGTSITIPVLPTSSLPSGVPAGRHQMRVNTALTSGVRGEPDINVEHRPSSDTDRADSAGSSSSCVGTFRPTNATRYVFSAWVRDDADPLAVSFDGPAVSASFTSVPFSTRGNIIDGWQQIYGEFLVPASFPSVTLTFTKGSGNTRFDDIRIYPIDATMITYVYDANTLKLTYTSDENNYFTKYNYDAAGDLESINRETEKGVQTVKEARSATVKVP